MATNKYKIARLLRDYGWFSTPGAYVSVDGQFGSTGKGVINGLLAELFPTRVDVVVSNAGPNSGHTAYFEGEKIVLKQLPTFGVVARKAYLHFGGSRGVFSGNPHIYLSAGAVIDPETLREELEEHGADKVYVHPFAARIDAKAKEADADTEKRIASTGKGVGPAIMEKLRRATGNVYGHGGMGGLVPMRASGAQHSIVKLDGQVCFFEVSQGFSLGINSGFYPHVTSRECTVAQALADASYPVRALQKVVMTVRAHPIRVGNTEGSSGPGYPDQRELTWEELGVPPEYTTVTGRQRRVFEFSRMQFKEAVWVNRPDVIFVNFMNYLPPSEHDEFIRKNISEAYYEVLQRYPEIILTGHGPTSDDVAIWA